MSKKAVKLGSFLQCSVHLFLVPDGCFIEWWVNYFQNFLETYHEELPGKPWSMWQHHVPQNIFLNLDLANSRILHFWQVLESLHKFVIALHLLQCLFVGGSNKNKGGVGLFQISSLTYISQVILQCSPPSCSLPKKVSLSPPVWARREYIWKVELKESLYTDLFENWQGAPCYHSQSRNRMKTFIIVNIAPICRYEIA